MSTTRQYQAAQQRESITNRDSQHHEGRLSDRQMSNDTPDASTISWSWRDHQQISLVEICSWKLKKGHDGGVFAVYLIHVSMRSGLRWVIEKRYQQFRQLRREVKSSVAGLSALSFPGKHWFFNLSDAVLKYRQEQLANFLAAMVAHDPQPSEVGVFLQIANNVSLSLQRHSSKDGNDTFSASSSTLRHRALRRNSKSQTSLAALSIKELPTVSDFKLIRVLGQGSFGKVYLVRPSDGAPNDVYAMKVTTM